MGACTDRLTLRALDRVEELTALTEAVDGFLERVNTDAETRYAVRFALEELFTNIVKYAFDDHDPHMVDIELRRSDHELALTLEDEGRPFDPTAAPIPDTTLSLEERPVGGLGLFLLRQLSGGMEYRRIDGRNRIRVLFQPVTSH